MPSHDSVEQQVSQEIITYNPERPFHKLVESLAPKDGESRTYLMTKDESELQLSELITYPQDQEPLKLQTILQNAEIGDKIVTVTANLLPEGNTREIKLTTGVDIHQLEFELFLPINRPGIPYYEASLVGNPDQIVEARGEIREARRGSSFDVRVINWLRDGNTPIFIQYFGEESDDLFPIKYYRSPIMPWNSKQRAIALKIANEEESVDLDYFFYRALIADDRSEVQFPVPDLHLNLEMLDRRKNHEGSTNLFINGGAKKWIKPGTYETYLADDWDIETELAAGETIDAVAFTPWTLVPIALTLYTETIEDEGITITFTGKILLDFGVGSKIAFEFDDLRIDSLTTTIINGNPATLANGVLIDGVFQNLGTFIDVEDF